MTSPSDQTTPDISRVSGIPGVSDIPGSKNASWYESGVLVVGARGMLGVEVVGALRPKVESSGGELAAWGVEELDIDNASAVEHAMRQVAPGVVINCAAYTDVDGCESHVDKAMAVNAAGVGNLARVCRDVNAVLVHVGTDFIFDGQSTKPYVEDDSPNPLSVYGLSKWEGERAIHDAGCSHLVVRTSWLFGLAGRNFVEAIADRALAGKPLRVVNDQTGRPTFTADLTDAMVRLLNVGARGTFHFANRSACTWFEFACEIVSQLGLAVDVAPITSGELSQPAQRPGYSVLDTGKYEATTGMVPPLWQDALRRYMAGRGCCGSGGS